MKFFDGLIVKFADRLCEHLEARRQERVKMAGEAASDDSGAWQRMLNLIVAEALAEFIYAIKTVRDS